MVVISDVSKEDHYSPTIGSGCLHLLPRETSPQVIVFALRELQGIGNLLQHPSSSNPIDECPNKTPISLVGSLPTLITAALPPHSTAQPALLDELNLPLRHGHGIVRDHRPAGAVIAPRCTRIRVQVLSGSWSRKGLVVPDTLLPATFADPGEGSTGAIGVGECASVQRHAQDHLRGWDTAHVDVVVQGRDGGEGGAGWVGGRWVEVGLVAGYGVPATGVVVAHEVVEVEVGGHFAEAEFGEVLRACL